MLFEVHSSARPGKPRALVALTAALLASALGVAWLQVREARAMGPEQRIAGTPLVVRAPLGWRVDPRNPRRLILPVDGLGGRLQRSMQFDYVRLPAFMAIEQLRELPELQVRGAAEEHTPVRIGGYPAEQIQQVLVAQVGRQRILTEVITRYTCLPRGEFIRITYEPLEAFRHSDYDMLDEVSASLRIEDPTLGGPPEQYLRSAGLQFPIGAGWIVVGSALPEAPGLFVGGTSPSGPAWSLALHRTWLAGDRTPADLLRDFAAHHWLAWDLDGVLATHERADGAAVALVRNPTRVRAALSTDAALVVARSPSEAVLIRVYTGLEHVDEALAAAQGIAEQVQFDPLPEIPEPSAALERGARLAEQLRNNGLVARWGRADVTTTYAPQDREEVIVVTREAVQRSPEAGYQGGQVWRRDLGQDELRWTIDSRAGAYQWQFNFYFSPQLIVRIEERRSRPDAPVVRQVFVNDQREQRFSYTPGPPFVPPPAEPVVQGWVARHEAEPVIYAASSTLGPATHMCLLRHLPPDGVWSRVLLQADYRPEGTIIAFDDERAEVQYEIHPGSTYRRIR